MTNAAIVLEIFYPLSDDAAPARPKSFVLIDRPEEVQKAREALPILGEECAVMEAVEANDAVILIGPTGCGKTTQVPQFLFEAGFAAKGKKIGVTEPRRVAAMAMARRVGHELNLSSQWVPNFVFLLRVWKGPSLYSLLDAK